MSAMSYSIERTIMMMSASC